MMIHAGARTAVSALAAAVLAAAGCAGRPAGPTVGAPAPASAPVPNPASSSGAPVGAATKGPGAKGPGSDDPGGKGKGAGVDAAPVEMLTGRVTAGVEADCLLLVDAQGVHLLLLGGDAAATVKVGATVTVTGRSDPDLATTCQQGVPFRVSAARAN